MGCRFCDTPGVFFRNKGVQEETGFHAVENPVSPEDVLHIVLEQDKTRPGAHSIAVTGGEPLEQVDFLEEFLPLLKKHLPELPLLLETAGLHGDAVERVSKDVDMVSMDFKIPSTSGLHGTRAKHEDFLSRMKGCRFYVKAIVDPRTPAREVVEAARAVQKYDSGAPFFLQPVSREGEVWGGAYLIELWSAARLILGDVRVLPQIHKSLALS